MITGTAIPLSKALRTVALACTTGDVTAGGEGNWLEEFSWARNTEEVYHPGTTLCR
jgi:hypothetical protein